MEDIIVAYYMYGKRACKGIEIKHVGEYHEK